MSVSATERDAIYAVIERRRDMRHFAAGGVDPSVLRRIVRAAHHAPSVGFMQPWRIIRITDAALRTAIVRVVDTERRRTAAALHEREHEFLALKVEGIRECGELLVVALMNDRERHVFGRRTLPEMDVASVGCAIQNMWLASCAEGLGMGWVSLFDPDALSRLLEMPPGSKPLAIVCLGHVDALYARPLLETEGWAVRAPIRDVLYENQWETAMQDERRD